MGKIKKKEDVFFRLFNEFCDEIVKAGAAFQDMVVDYTDIENKADNMNRVESDCDKRAHAIDDELRKSFVTPFDREDIFSLTRQLDEIVDFMEDVANSFYTYGVKKIRPEVIEMVDLILKSIDMIKEVFSHLPEIKKSASTVTNKIIAINDIENEGDRVFRASMKRLFDEEKDPIELIKWKRIFEQLEDSLDACESVANIVEGIVVKYV